MLTTGVDAPTCKNVVLARVVGSMTEFKQIIGRGTRLKDEYGKFFFNIIDYTGSATRLFADPDFDGEPALITEEQIDDAGNTVPGTETEQEAPVPPEENTAVIETGETADTGGDSEGVRRKYYFDGGYVEVVAHMVSELDADGKQLRLVKFIDYTGEKVRTLYSSPIEFRQKWADAKQRAEIIEALEDRGIDLDRLRAETHQPDADPLDLLCHLAFNAPLRTRRERADQLRKLRPEFFTHYAPEARIILEDLLEKYADHGAAQFVIPDILKLPPISDHGNVMEIAALFGGPDHLRSAVNELQSLLYAS
jgi:type I restriction enzyme R subunit